MSKSAPNPTAHANPEEPSPSQEAIREGGYGWVCVACVFLMNAHTWGINAAYGVFLSYYLSSDMLPGTSSLEYAFVGGLSIGCAMIIAPLATYLAHQISPRFVLNLGTILETISLITTSFVKTDWQLFLSQGICFGFGMGLCFCGSVGIPSHWFKRMRSLVNGITAAGSGVGGLVYSLAAGKMIPELGFPWAMRSLGYVCLLFSLPSYSVAIGLTQKQGSRAGALLSLGQAFGRPVVGLLSDHLGRVNVAFASSLASGLLSLVLWIFAGSVGLTYFFAVAVGLFAGTFLAAAAPLTAEVVGLEDLGAGLGIFWLSLGPPTAVAEVIALQLRDSPSEPKPYLRIQIFVGLMYIGSAASLAGLWFEMRRKKVSRGGKI
ncbi:hypothetical protein PENANT_c007G00765 [Penicillium antarcticum]|uniref:Major facilitator superfamily (MFS) profile domain-containing protein n=1 Tax=Penicillium antarcticum TaxID=416450 RepID=A0A1V6QB82_9EURO|nr:hypothetical protein PENANT_c007G00765 [Penicillium antarcticum]